MCLNKNIYLQSSGSTDEKNIIVQIYLVYRFNFLLNVKWR